MRETLQRWLRDAGALHQIRLFGMTSYPQRLQYIAGRAEDCYLSIVGEMFSCMRSEHVDAADWSRLGNAFLQFADGDALRGASVNIATVRLLAASAFYLGGLPASAYLCARDIDTSEMSERGKACVDLLGRPFDLRSRSVSTLLSALANGDPSSISQVVVSAGTDERDALARGPEDWIFARVFLRLLARFESTNLRAILPDGFAGKWSALVNSFLARRPPTWDLFPSQISAISGGVLQTDQTFSLQMPTGAGKTALCEIILYEHLLRHPVDVAVLVVPFRSLASELRSTLVRHMNSMGVRARCAYGGTVPTGDEVRGLDQTRVLVATPEALLGLIGSDPDFFGRMSLVICDEGHLLDAGSRGVGLELLLARMKTRATGSPKFVFVSAIVPNIEEINTWLGGTAGSVVRSDYKPSAADYGVLRSPPEGASAGAALVMHPHEPPETQYSISSFLKRSDFQWINPRTGRINTFALTSVKTRAVAAARRCLNMGAVVVFATNKRGDQGVIGLAEELIRQMQQPLQLPDPLSFAKLPTTQPVLDYLREEYGDDWVGVRALAFGAIVHHGDIPQESREALESLLRLGDVRLALCTSTLAEGVNLPVRTLVLYSVRRMGSRGRREDMLARDIKNLVGRAGRAGNAVRGLVICANPDDWELVEPVARLRPGERVVGALFSLMSALRNLLRFRGVALSDEMLEGYSDLFTLVDGIDATLVELASEELGEGELESIALDLANRTFAASQIDQQSGDTLREVFRLRAQRVQGVLGSGRLSWLRSTGARLRLLSTVETGLLPLRQDWHEISDAVAEGLVATLLQWAWTQPDFRDAAVDAFRLSDESALTISQQSDVLVMATMWITGKRFVDMSRGLTALVSMDDVLAVHSKLVSYSLMTLVEQGLALLAKILESQGRLLPRAIEAFPALLRFGVPTEAAAVLASKGLRYRKASVALGSDDRLRSLEPDQWREIVRLARSLIEDEAALWRPLLGVFVYEATVLDLQSIATG